MSQHGKIPDERAPLLASQPSTLDAENEALPDEDVSQTASQSMSAVRGVFCLFGLGCLIFLQATNISLLTTTQSSIAADLDAFEQTNWFTSSYLISMSSLSPIMGKLAQIFSPRICIFLSAVVLAVGALIASWAEAFPVFIVGRVICGLGAAGIFTVSIILVLELSSPKRRGIMIGLLNAGYTTGVALGATAAGALLPRVGWRALFWMQAPVLLLGGSILLFAIPHDFTSGNKTKNDDSVSTRLARLDYVGAATLTTGIVLALYALSSPKTIPILPLILSLIVFITFVLNEAYIATDPIVPVSLMKSRGLAFTCLGTVGYMMARWSVLFYSPTYALAVRDWAPAAAGSILIATNGGFGIGGVLVGWLHIRRHGSFYLPSLIVYAVFPCTLLILASISTAHSPPVLYVLVLFLNGFVTGAALNYTLAHLLHLTPKNTHYIATSLVATFRGFAGSFGSAIGGGIFTRVLNTSLKTGFKNAGLDGEGALVRRLLGSPALVGQLRGVEREVAVQGYEEALRYLWVSAAGLAALMVVVQASTGWRRPDGDVSGEVEGLVEDNERSE